MLGERVLRVTVKPFMDMNTMIEERLTQCCVHVATVGATVNGETGDHQCAPFCAVQAWAPLSASRISTATGLPLLDGRMSDPRLVEPDRAQPDAPYDPLRLCIFATIALLGWVLGPLALAFFAGLGIVGYARPGGRGC